MREQPETTGAGRHALNPGLRRDVSADNSQLGLHRSVQVWIQPVGQFLLLAGPAVAIREVGSTILLPQHQRQEFRSLRHEYVSGSRL